MVDASGAAADLPQRGIPVHAAAPAHVTEGVVLPGPPPLEERLGPPVAALLTPVGSQRWPAVVPDHRGGAEADLHTPLLQTPAGIDVVPRHTEGRVEALDGGERRAPKRHVASGDVLRFGVRHEHVDRATRGVRDRVREQGILGWRHVGPADGGEVGRDEGPREVGQPIAVGVGVVVDVGDDLPRGRAPADVAGRAQSAILLRDHAHVVPLRDRAGRVRRPVVDDDDLEVRVVDPRQRLQGVGDGPGAVVGADDHRDGRPSDVGWEGHVPEGARGGPERRLRAAVATRQPERPVVDVRTRAEPLVRPGEHDDAGAAGGKGRPHLPVDHLSLESLAIPEGVEADLAHENRPVAGDAVQPRQVGFEAIPGLEVDVERQQVEERQLEVLRRGVVHVRDGTSGVLVLHCRVEAFEVSLDLPATQPAGDRRRDLVPEAVAEQGGMAGDRAHLLPDDAFDVRRIPRVREVADVLFRRQADHHPEAVARGRIEEGDRGHRVGDAHGVEPGFGHLREVPLDGVVTPVLVAVRVRLERAVRDALDPELLAPCVEELAADDGATPGGRVN